MAIERLAETVADVVFVLRFSGFVSGTEGSKRAPWNIQGYTSIMAKWNDSIGETGTPEIQMIMV